MRDDDDNDSRLYVVVVNHERQYSIWLAHNDAPTGWTTVGQPQSRVACLDYIEEVWTDMRPLSVARRMESEAGHA
jgi:MbtH protein